MRFHRARLCSNLLFLCAVISGCKDKAEVKVYRVSKAEPLLASPSDNQGMGRLPQNSAPAETIAPIGKPSKAMGNPPPNWEAQPLTSMRLASYLVKGAHGESADISLVALAGTAGGVLDNVNRWLSQLGQPAITEEKLAQTMQKVAAPLGDVTVVDLAGLPQGGDATKDGRIIAGIASGDAQTFFFKMRGNAVLAESQKGAFIQWIGTVQRTGEASSPKPAAPAAPTAGAEDKQQ